MLNEVAFLKEREANWKRLTFLCDKADVSPINLTKDEVQELIRLYRKATTDLALLRTQSSNLQMIDFLNNLTGKAYTIIYRTPRGSLGKAIVSGLTIATRTFRRCKWFVAASTATFFLAAFFAAALMNFSPDAKAVLVPEQWKGTFDGWKSGKHERRTGEESMGMTGFYLGNNPRAAIMTGSMAAATFGVGSFALIWQNGMLVGTLGAEVASVGQLGHLLASIAPHGVPEIGGLFIAGAAGYRMGWALIAPGRRRRGAALTKAGKDAIVLLAVSVLMMFIAAPIEGFFSFNPDIPYFVKVLVAVVSLAAWLMFWFRYAYDPEIEGPDALA